MSITVGKLMKATIVVKKRSRGLTDELITAIEQKLVKVKVNRTVTATRSDADVETASTPLAITLVCQSGYVVIRRNGGRKWT